MYQNDKHKTNSQQHKDRESCSRKSNRIPRDFFKFQKQKQKKMRKKLIEALDLRQKTQYKK